MSANKEKGQVEYVESGSGSDGKEGHGGEFYNGGEDGGVVGYENAYEKKLIRKVDYRLLPILGALYAISLIDRVNVRNFGLLFYAPALSLPPLFGPNGRGRLTICSRYLTRAWRAWARTLVYKSARGTPSSSLCSLSRISFSR